jgi:hypothetical protein
VERSDFLAALSAAALSGVGMQTQPKSVAGVVLPNTPMAIEATTIAKTALPPEIYNHSLRTFLFAELLAQTLELMHDAELLYVASILHDTGLMPQYMSKTEHFQVDSANLASSLLDRYNVAAEKRDVVWDAIALHDQGAIAKWKQSEVRLVNAGVSADFGARLELLSRTDVAAVLAAAPRKKFVPVFLDAAATLAARKPNVAAPSWLNDVAVRMVHGIHFDNFVDDVESVDPFSSYQ